MPTPSHHHVVMSLTWSDVNVALWFDRTNPYDNRSAYAYRITDLADGSAIVEGDDLNSGVNSQPSLPTMMATLVSFLEAWIEAGEDGENADLFPAEARDALDWDELLMMLRSSLESES